jgi:hypothetical protein
VADRDYENALAQFAAVTDVRPEAAFEFYRAVAYAAYQTGDEETARSTVRRAAQYANDPVGKASIASLAAAVGENLGHLPPAPSAAPTASPTTGPAIEMGTAATPETLQRTLPSTVEGTLDRIECLENATRLHVMVDGRPMRFLTDSQRAVEIRGRKGRPFTLVCGPLKPPAAVLVEYEPMVNAKLGTIGVVRALELK